MGAPHARLVFPHDLTGHVQRKAVLRRGALGCPHEHHRRRFGSQPDFDEVLDMIWDHVLELERTECVWNKMRKSPHCFELAAAHGQLESLDMRLATRS